MNRAARTTAESPDVISTSWGRSASVPSREGPSGASTSPTSNAAPPPRGANLFSPTVSTGIRAASETKEATKGVLGEV